MDLLVLGARECDLVLVMEAITRGHERTIVLPQDGFLDLVLFEQNWWAERPVTGRISRLEQAVQQQDGLRIAKFVIGQWKELTFKWPETEDVPGEDESPWSSRLNEVSALKERGYQIADRTEDQRWSALERCERELGLQRVAYFIAFLIRTRSGRVRALVIDAWRSDLEKLRSKYHVEALEFDWPDV